jgi:dienelactone hydrolase
MRILLNVFFILGCFLLAGATEARVKRIEPGEMPKLDADEGLLVIVIDTNSYLADVRLRKDGKLFNAATIKDVVPGATPVLYVVPAGTYEWSRVSAHYRFWYEFKDSPDTKFKVEAGALNYPGDMLMRGKYTNASTFLFTNRSLQIMDWLEDEHPQLMARYGFAYTGHYPDPFPAMYLKAKAEAAKPYVELSVARKPPMPEKLPIDIREMWRVGQVEGADLNARGDMMVKVLRKSDGYHFELIDMPSGKVMPLLVGCCGVESMQWAGNDVFVVSSRPDGSNTLHVDVFRFGLDAKGARTFQHVGKSRPGIYAQVLPEDPDHILFASHGDMNRLLVHRVNIRSQQTIDRFQAMHGTRLNQGVKDDRYWFADGRGRLRLALANSGDEAVLMYGMGDAFEEVLRFGLKQPFDPMLLSYEGDVIYGLSDDGRAQRDLVVFDPRQKKIVSTLFSKPGVDIVSPIVDGLRQPIGAVYYQNGHLVSEYFDEQGREVNALLQDLFPGKTVAAYDRADNGDLLAWVESSQHAGALYHVDSARRRAQIIDAAKPWLKGYDFVDTEVLSVSGPDGMPIEAYLTRPHAKDPRPLIVLSHGGPVGVRDSRGFDPEVQFLAAMGYAVLQVNFRGSDGFGTQFRDSGRRAHGTLIEDDIDAVLQKVLKDPDIDGSRLCAIGASYGGYSALVSTIRWPDRFKCVVSISGVTDWMLFFTASDGGNYAKGREVLEHYIGNPRTDGEALMKVSPIYRYRELKTPLLLVHGAEDTRVDYEHTRRLVRMLNIAGVRPALITIEKEGHSFGKLDSVETAWKGIAGFLRRHLDAPKSTDAGAAKPPTIQTAPTVRD